jgi:hypothetical protein
MIIVDTPRGSCIGNDEHDESYAIETFDAWKHRSTETAETAVASYRLIRVWSASGSTPSGFLRAGIVARRTSHELRLIK